MKYPVISLENAVAFYRAADAGSASDPGDLVSYVGDGDPLSVDALTAPVIASWAQVVSAVEAEGLDGMSRKQKAETLVSGAVHRSLIALPVSVLDDPDFWRFLGLVPLRALVEYCDSRPDGSIQPTGREDVPGLTDHVLRRAFLRGQMHCRPGLDDPYASITAFGEAGTEATGRWRERDFVKSHLVRIRVGQTPAAARALAEVAADPYMKRDDLRGLVKVMTRARRDVALELYGDADASEFARDQRRTFEALDNAN